MSWEYEDLFDALAEEQAEDLAAAFWRSEPTAIRVGSMGYRTRTIKAGDRLEAEVYPIFGREKAARLREARRNITPERQQKQNIARAKRRLVLLIEANFRVESDYHLTLTYADPQPDLERVKKDIRNFFGKVKRLREKRGIGELKFLYTIGHDAGKRIHAHVIINGGIGREELEKIWGHGIANGSRLQEYGSGLQGIANYLYRQNEQERLRGNRRNLKSWSGSRNLVKPKQRTSDSKVSNRQVKRIAHGFGSVAKEIMERKYPGYALQDCKVYYSDVVDGVYIRCVMRRWKG